MDILIVGVGGQGTLLASRVLGKYAVMKGYDCKLSEVHGMAQRGGSVVTHVRFAEKVFSPIVSEGTCDVVLSFELLEAIRYKHFLKEGGKIVVNDQEVFPMPVIMGKAQYPENPKDRITEGGVSATFVPALALAEKAGNKKAVNVVILGAFCHVAGLDYETMKSAVRECVPQKFLELNLKAFELGYENE